jgi:DNA adenine methylase
VLGDLNPELIATYRALRRDAGLVCECLRRLPVTEHDYYRIRAIDPKPLSETETAARFLYLNRNCFNGIYRTNLSGRFNVPYGPPKNGAGFDYSRIIEAAKLLTRTELVHGDFSETLSRVEPGDFVYLDPPYAVADRRIFSEYYHKTFSIHDLSRLGEHLNKINRIGATFVISYADSKEARALFSSWATKRVRARRNIAGFAANRRHAYELIATNQKETSNAE